MIILKKLISSIALFAIISWFLPVTFAVNSNIRINVEKKVENANGTVSTWNEWPFDLKVICKNGNEYDFSLSNNWTGSFEYPANTKLDCSISETLTWTQIENYSIKKIGDSFGPDNGRMLASNSNDVNWEKFYVINKKKSKVTINVEKKVENADGTVSTWNEWPFDLNVTCKNGDVHDFSLNNNWTGSFEYPANTALDCSISEVLTAEQSKDYILKKLWDSFWPDNGRMLTANSNDVDWGKFYVINKKKPKVTINVEKKVENADGTVSTWNEWPFALKVKCKNGKEFDFSLNNNWTGSFEYPADTKLDCKISEELTDEQSKDYILKKLWDSFWPDNGRMLSSNSNDVNWKKFYIINKKKTDNKATFYVKKEVIDWEENEWPFVVKVKCENGQEFNYSLYNNQVSYFEYPSAESMDCSISEELTDSQEAIYMKRSWDTYWPDNGRVLASKASDADNNTFYVLNKRKSAEDETKVKVELSFEKWARDESKNWYLPKLLIKGNLAYDQTVEVRDLKNWNATPNVDYAYSTRKIVIPAWDYDGTDATSIPLADFNVVDDKVSETHEIINFVLEKPSSNLMVIWDANSDFKTTTNYSYTISNNDYWLGGSSKSSYRCTNLEIEKNDFEMEVETKCTAKSGVKTFKIDCWNGVKKLLHPKAGERTINYTCEYKTPNRQFPITCFTSNKVTKKQSEVLKSSYYCRKDASFIRKKPPVDDCPKGDFSKSPFDGKCGKKIDYMTPKAVLEKAAKKLQEEAKKKREEEARKKEEEKKKVEEVKKEEIKKQEEKISKSKRLFFISRIEKLKQEEEQRKKDLLNEKIKENIVVKTKFKLPMILPATWTPRGLKGIKVIKQKRVETSDPKWFKPSYTEDINDWLNILPYKVDKNNSKYLVLPSIWLVAPIGEVNQNSSDYKKVMNWRVLNFNKYLQTWVMQYPGTAEVGNIWNTVIFGHSSYWKNDSGRYKTIFTKIMELDPGEEIWVYVKVWNKYTLEKYKVNKSYETNPRNTSVLLPKKGKNLTLFTCTNIWTAQNRWILEAKYLWSASAKKSVTNSYITTKVINKVKKIVAKLLEKSSDIRRDLILSLFVRIDELRKDNSNNIKLLKQLSYLERELAKIF